MGDVETIVGHCRKPLFSRVLRGGFCVLDGFFTPDSRFLAL